MQTQWCCDLLLSSQEQSEPYTHCQSVVKECTAVQQPSFCVPLVGIGQIKKCKDRRRTREDNHSQNTSTFHSEPRAINLIISVMGALWVGVWIIVIRARAKCEGTASCKIECFLYRQWSRGICNDPQCNRNIILSHYWGSFYEYWMLHLKDFSVSQLFSSSWWNYDH